MLRRISGQKHSNAFMSPNQEIIGSVSVPDWKGSVVCPIPRPVALLTNNPMRPLRCHVSHQAEVFDSKAGAELLDIILKKEGFRTEQSATQLASSPPFFSGSPPSRTANPLIQDARFGDEKLTSLSASRSPSGLSSPSSACKGGGCIRMKFGLKPAAVRVEGFDCLNRDHQHSSIPAVA
ncbi:unnamed protein product [Camellia sinensis]